MAEREAVVDFTIPFYDLVGLSILMKKARTDTYLFRFMEVFELEVWICILIAYISTSLLMWVFDRWSPYSYQNNIEKYQVSIIVYKSILKNTFDFPCSLMRNRGCST